MSKKPADFLVVPVHSDGERGYRIGPRIHCSTIENAMTILRRLEEDCRGVVLYDGASLVQLSVFGDVPDDLAFRLKAGI